MELLFFGLLSHRSDADIVEDIFVVVGCATGFGWIGAVVLEVRHLFHCWQLAPEFVVSVDSHVDESLDILEEVLADQVAAIRTPFVSYALELAICVVVGLEESIDLVIEFL